MRLIKLLSLLICLLGSACVGLSSKDKTGSEDVVLDKEKSNLYFSIAQSYERNERTEEAVENYQEAISLDRSNYQAHFFLGKLLIRRNFIKEGLSRVEYAAKSPEGYTAALNFLAAHHLKNRNPAKAKVLIDKSAKDLTYKNQEETWALKLKIEHKLNLTDDVLDTLPKVLALKTRHCPSRVDIAATLYKMKLYSHALGSARSAEKICGDKQLKNQAVFIKGLVFIKRNNPLVAEKILNAISPHTESFKKMLNRAQTVVRKKINSGI